MWFSVRISSLLYQSLSSRWQKNRWNTYLKKKEIGIVKLEMRFFSSLTHTLLSKWPCSTANFLISIRLYFSPMHQHLKIRKKILTETKWTCMHGDCPLHLSYSWTQCVDSFRDLFEGISQFPLSNWIFKYPSKDENPSPPPHFKKSPEENRFLWPFILSYPQIPKMLYDGFENTFVCSDRMLLVRKEPCAHLSLVSHIGVWSFSVLEMNNKLHYVFDIVAII